MAGVHADETAQFLQYLPRNRLATSNETAKERLTAVVCSNAAGTHECRLMIINKSAHLWALKGIKSLPVIYKNNQRA